MDLVHDEIVSFHNVLDKGCRVTQHILRNNQKIIQPICSVDGRGLAGDEGLCISEVASDRSGNERAVKCIKQSDYLTNGLNHHQSFDRVNTVWKSFGFQSNFMHCPIV